ncbi:hypothetical protein [Streptomyces mirabilis]|uniref:hypothetical protein n=1 Tax=Streptomyces mirabilis TaxID=68239 RepID=UPI0036882CD9
MAVVQAAGTDAWGAVRDRAARMLGRGDAQRQQDELVRLDQTEADLTGEGDVDRRRMYWEGVWQARLELLLDSLSAHQREQVIAELRLLVQEAGSSATGSQHPVTEGGVTAGGDVSVTADGGSVAGGVLRVDGGVHLAPPFPGSRQP